MCVCVAVVASVVLAVRDRFFVTAVAVVVLVVGVDVLAVDALVVFESWDPSHEGCKAGSQHPPENLGQD